MSGEEMVEKQDPLHKVLNQEIMDELQRCCNALPPPYKEIARKHFVEGKTAREISEQTGKGLNTIQTQIYRSRELLKKSFRKGMLKE